MLTVGNKSKPHGVKVLVLHADKCITAFQIILPDSNNFIDTS